MFIKFTISSNTLRYPRIDQAVCMYWSNNLPLNDYQVLVLLCTLFYCSQTVARSISPYATIHI
jgi:hypothetical protein